MFDCVDTQSCIMPFVSTLPYFEVYSVINDPRSIDDVRQTMCLATLIQELIFSLIDRLYTPNRLVSLLPPVLILTGAQKSGYRYSVEILPFAIRAKGFVVFNFMVSLSVIFNQCVLLKV